MRLLLVIILFALLFSAIRSLKFTITHNGLPRLQHHRLICKNYECNVQLQRFRTKATAAASDVGDGEIDYLDGEEDTIASLDFLVEDEDVITDDDDGDDDDDDDDSDDDTDEDAEDSLSDDPEYDASLSEDGKDDDKSDMESLDSAQKIRLTKKKRMEARYKSDESPTRDWTPPVAPYSRIVVGVAEVSDVSKRREAWLHHMQWIRRSVLEPNNSIQCTFEYTCLSDDSMTPVRQIIGFLANETDDVVGYFEQEPLTNHEAVSKWKMYEFSQVQNDQFSLAQSPLLFIGSKKPNTSSKRSGSGKNNYDDSNQVLDSFVSMNDDQLDYHAENCDRIVKMGELKAVDGVSSDATLIIFNAPTNAEAKRYIEKDPIVKSKAIYESMFLSSVNEQDIDGMNLAMPRSFSEQTQLDSIHYMDPEDLLLVDLPALKSLPNHNSENRRVIEVLKHHGISYKYNRFNPKERYGSTTGFQRAEIFNSELDQYQRERLRSSADAFNDGDEIVIAEEADSGDFGGDFGGE